MAPSSESKLGGDLSDMAVTGTSIPGDAGKMNLIPSVPRPGEGEPTDSVNANRSALAGAASNPTDISRSVKDQAATGEVETGTGYVFYICRINGQDANENDRDQLPGAVENKRLHASANNPLSKGHDRYDKHSRQKESDIERYASEGAGVDLQPSEDAMAKREDVTDAEVDRVIDSREKKQT